MQILEAFDILPFTYCLCGPAPIMVFGKKIKNGGGGGGGIGGGGGVYWAIGRKKWCQNCPGL